MFAVVSSGGKQYRVEPGAILSVDRLEGEPGSPVTFERVLLLSDGEQVSVGSPTVSGASVTGTVIGPERGSKITVFKFRPKVHYRRRTGHRQELTRIRIDEIRAPGLKASSHKGERAASKKGEAGTPAKKASRPAAKRTRAKPATARAKE